MPDLPIGTVALLFTDIEASTRLWQEQPDAMRAALARHDDLLHRSIADHHGLLVKSTGDGALAAFGTATDAIGAAIVAQRAIDTEPGRYRSRSGSAWASTSAQPSSATATTTAPR